MSHCYWSVVTSSHQQFARRRPAKFDLAKAKEMRTAGVPYSAMAKALGVSTGTMHSVLSFPMARPILYVEQTVCEGHFDEPKTRASTRLVPLSGKAAEILKLLMPEPVNREALVFGTKKGTPFCRRNLMDRQVAPACAALGLPRVTWHPLRHCSATLLDHVGTPRGTVTAILGHDSQEITARYVHALPAGGHEAVEKLEALLTGPKRTQIAEIQNLGSTLIQ